MYQKHTWIQGASILRHRTSGVSHIVYVTGALLERAHFGGGLARNCDSYVIKLTYWTRQMPLDKPRMFERACASVQVYVTGSVPQDDSALNVT